MPELPEDFGPEDIIGAGSDQVEAAHSRLAEMLEGRAKVLGAFRKALAAEGFSDQHTFELIRDWHLEFMATPVDPSEGE